LTEATTQTVGQRFREIEAYVVGWTCDRSAGVVVRRELIATPGGAALLASAVAGRVATERGAIRPLHAMAFRTVVVPDARLAERCLAGHVASSQTVAAASSRLAR
jgi:hypothetical protein